MIHNWLIVLENQNCFEGIFKKQEKRKYEQQEELRDSKLLVKAYLQTYLLVCD